jgi:chitinase
MRSHAFLLLFLIATLASSWAEEVISKAQSFEPIVAAYYENSSQYRRGVGGRPSFEPKLIDPNILTDLYYSCAIFSYATRSIDPSNPHNTGDYKVLPVEWNDLNDLYKQVQSLKQINPKLRTILSIGGKNFCDPNDEIQMGSFTYRNFSRMISSIENRREFIDSAIFYAQNNGFDGIDIDWQYPGCGPTEDVDNFPILLSELSQACQSAIPSLVLTCAAPPMLPTGVPKSFLESPSDYFRWWAECAKYVDRINILAYDYHSPFDKPMITGINAPLNHDTLPTSNNFIAHTVQDYVRNGVPPEKIVLVAPIFGRTYGSVKDLTKSNNGPGKRFQSVGDPGPSTQLPGFLAYFEIEDLLIQKKLTFATDETTSTVYGYNFDKKQWASFDTPQTIRLKAKLAKDQGLRGIAFWAVDTDEYFWEPKFPNIRAGYDVFYPSSQSTEVSLENTTTENKEIPIKLEVMPNAKNKERSN